MQLIYLIFSTVLNDILIIVNRTKCKILAEHAVRLGKERVEGVTPAPSFSCCLFTSSLGTSLNS